MLLRGRNYSNTFKGVKMSGHRQIYARRRNKFPVRVIYDETNVPFVNDDNFETSNLARHEQIYSQGSNKTGKICGSKATNIQPVSRQISIKPRG